MLKIFREGFLNPPTPPYAPDYRLHKLRYKMNWQLQLRISQLVLCLYYTSQYFTWPIQLYLSLHACLICNFYTELYAHLLHGCTLRYHYFLLPSYLFILLYWTRPTKLVLDKIKTHGSVSCGPRKRGMRKRSEYIDRNNKVSIFTHLQLRDSLSKWHQIYSGVSLHEREAMFQILTRSLKLFSRYESAKFRKNFFVFSSSFCTLCKNSHNSCVYQYQYQYCPKDRVV